MEGPNLAEQRLPHLSRLVPRHVKLPFHWQILKPNLQALLPGEAYDPASIKFIADRDTAFSITPHRGVFSAHKDHEFILTFAPCEVRGPEGFAVKDSVVFLLSPRCSPAALPLLPQAQSS